MATNAPSEAEFSHSPEERQPRGRTAWFKSGILVLTSETLAKASSFGVLILLVRGLSIEGYGAFAVLSAGSAIAFSLADFGMTAWGLKRFSQDGGLHDFKPALSAKLALSVLAAAVLWGASVASGLPLSWQLITGYLFFQFSASVGILSRAAARAHGMGGREVWARAAERITLFAAAALALAMGLGATGFGSAFAVAGVVSLIAHARLIPLAASAHRSTAGRRQASLKILRQSAPFGLSTFFVLIYFKADTVMLGLIRGTAEAAHYAMAYAVVEALGLLPAAITTAAWPALVRASALSRPAQFQTLFHLLMSLGIPIGAGLLVVGDDLLELAFGPAAEGAGLAILVLVPALLASFGNYAVGTLLQTNGNEGMVARLSGAAALLNIVLNSLLIPAYGIPGAAAATLASEILFFLGAARHGSIRPSIRASLNSVAPPMIAAFLMVAVIASLPLSTLTSRGAELAATIVIGFAAYAAALVALDRRARDIIWKSKP